MALGARHERHIAFLLGKPLRSGSILAEVIERVLHHWETLAIHRPSERGMLPDAVFESSIVVQRGLDEDGLALASKLENSGVRCINPIVATLACHDRLAVMRALAEADILVPETSIVPSWTEFLSLANGQPIVVKTLDGNAGRGVNVLISPSGILPPPTHRSRGHSSPSSIFPIVLRSKSSTSRATRYAAC